MKGFQRLFINIMPLISLGVSAWMCPPLVNKIEGGQHEGLSLAMVVFVTIYFGVSAANALLSLHRQYSWSTLRSFLAYAPPFLIWCWVVLVAVVNLSLSDWIKPVEVWSTGITVVFVLVAALYRFPPQLSRWNKSGARWGMFAAAVKAVPQLAQAIKITLYGGSSLPFVVIVAGMIGIISVFIPTIVAYRASRTDAKLLGNVFSSWCNLISWSLVLAVWLFWYTTQ